MTADLGIIHSATMWLELHGDNAIPGRAADELGTVLKRERVETFDQLLKRR